MSTTTFLFPGPLPPWVAAPCGLKKSKRDGAAARRVPGRRLLPAGEASAAPKSGLAAAAKAVRVEARAAAAGVQAGVGTMKALVVAASVAPRASSGL